MNAMLTSVNDIAIEARSWLLQSAAPLWADRGRTDFGYFAERMTLAGVPDASYFRTFVQARHVFSFVAIGKLGWSGPWAERVAETIQAILTRAKRSDGFFVHLLDGQGEVLDSRADLYDQAFVLFALGCAGGALGRSDWLDEAEALLDCLESRWAHPRGGFYEGEIADTRVRRQNPHMHLLEAFLALYEASRRPRFLKAALAIAELAQQHFIDPETGALLEYFTDDLAPAPGIEGTIAEPGHCCEWAWLFERLAARDWYDGRPLSDRLTRFARAHGVAPAGGVMINEVLTDGSPHNRRARLWPQTERLKAATARYDRLRSDTEIDEIVDAARGLALYLDVPVKGLWRDKLTEDGQWIEELAPGSSLYHIACGYAELEKISEIGEES
jgi:mannose-6-phosphate isomerase